MILRALALAIVALIGAAIYYLSRFWDYRFWSRDGLFGVEQLRPQGGLVGQWLRGTDFAPFELLIWAVGAFLVLTIVQKIFDLFKRTPPDEGDAP